MSTQPPGLVKLRTYIEDHPAPDINIADFLGIIGDTNHTRGYHLGPDRIFNTSDYSIQTTRDKAGAKKYPRYASAIDIGMVWKGSRNWLAWLVQMCKDGKFPHIREVIGSLDGKKALYWSATSGWKTQTYTGSGHVSHTHISVYRDSAEFDHSNILKWYFDGVPVPPKPAPPKPKLGERGTRDLKLTKPYMKGNDVGYVQRFIGPKRCGKDDEVYGPKTTAGVKWWQKMRGRKPTGVMTRADWRDMGVKVHY